jgi:alpha-acetolactate decarboxylase
MTLRELKNWLDKLPEHMLDFTVVNGEVGMLDGEYMYRIDKPITTLTVDEENKEVVILNDSQETEDNIKNNNG